jgi:hypothetical protein
MTEINKGKEETNCIKIRDDRIPIKLSKLDDPTRKGIFNLADDGRRPSWISTDKKEITISDLHSGIEPWLTSLFQSDHLSLLTGSGLSTAIQYLAGGKPNSGMRKPTLTNQYAQKIEKAVCVSVARNGRGSANIEDYIRVINELIRGLEILGKENVDCEPLERERKEILDGFLQGITNIENSIATAKEEERLNAFNCLVNFLMSFASRTGTRDRLNIFSTNYDRVIESGAEIAGLHLLDRFTGILTPIFRSSRLDIDMHYNPPGIRGEPRYLEGVARFTKLHGSIDWVEYGNDIRRIGLPFGTKNIDPYLATPGLDDTDSTKVMIYPNASKDRETAEYPYVELFRDFATALCRPNSTLVTYGYGFGDDHINRIIRDMLTIPSTHLVVISYDDAQGRIMKNYEKIGRPSQITLLIGPDISNIKTLTEKFLPKPSIDKASIRMSELLKQRYTTTKPENEPDSSLGGAVKK